MGLILISDGIEGVQHFRLRCIATWDGRIADFMSLEDYYYYGFRSGLLVDGSYSTLQCLYYDGSFLCLYQSAPMLLYMIYRGLVCACLKHAMLCHHSYHKHSSLDTTCNPMPSTLHAYAF